MIRQNDNAARTGVARTLGRFGFLVVCAGAAGFLPLSPSWAQQESQPAEVTVVTAPAEENEPTRLTEVQIHPVPNTNLVEVRAPAQTRVVQVTPTRPYGVVREVPVVINPLTPATSAAESDRALHDVQMARARVEQLTAELAAAKARLANAEAIAGKSGQPGGKLSPKKSSKALGLSLKHENYATSPKQRGAEDSQRRLDELERKLDRLLDEVHELKETRGSRGAGNPPVSYQRM